MMRVRAVQMLAAVGMTIGLLVGHPAVRVAAEPGPVQVEPTSRPDRIVLTPTASPHDSQTFSWRTDMGIVSGVVEIGEAGSRDVRRIAAGEHTRGQHQHGAMHHTATVRDLEQSTTYRYRVGEDAGGWSGWYEFTTASRELHPWNFLYFGDAQNFLGDVWPDVSRRAFAEYPDAALGLHAGDLINNADSDEEWALWFAGQGDEVRTRNVIATPGNHEFKNDEALAQYQAHFGFPRNGPSTRGEDVWFTDYQGVRFISLNANVLVGLDQVLWTYFLLANNPNKWTVVTFHQPLFSASTGRDNFGVRMAWQPMFEQFGVDLVLQGHDHVYARGHMEDEEAPDGTHSGTVYVVSVAGGKYYDLSPRGDNVWTWNGATREVAAQQISTYQSISVDRDRLTYRSVVGRLAERPQPAGLAVGDTLDAFTITKDSDGKKVVTNQVPANVAAADIPGVAFDPFADWFGDLVK